MSEKGFQAAKLSNETRDRLKDLARQCRGDILKMTTLAGCGHPGGSMSSLEMYLLLWSLANVAPDRIHDPGRDRIVVSHGHTAPGVYSVLGRLGFVNADEAVAHFRQAGSLFEGHVERTVPGCEWSTGNLGQGLSAACGFALSARLLKKSFRVYCVMGDGEQEKGQIVEAQRFAAKYHLTNLIAFVDRNYLQISGDTRAVMPMDVAAQYRASGWNVIDCKDGNDFDQVYAATRHALAFDNAPTLVIAETIMSRGVPFMENKEEWHGKALPEADCRKALEILGLADDIEKYKAMRKAFRPGVHHEAFLPPVNIKIGEPRTYPVDKPSDCRGAWGVALEDIAKLNKDDATSSPMAVFDCDLASSVRTTQFAKILPENFFQAGIAEHHTSAMAGAVSTQGVVSFWSDFAAFGTDEVYNQNRLNDINNSNLKLVLTHAGVDVGEDGRTHQCIDYVANFRSLYGFRVIVPADPNETDRAIRFAASHDGNYLVAMGRSKLLPVAGADGKPLFAGDYQFEYGKATFIREGKDACIIAMGMMIPRALKVHEILKAKGISAAILNMSSPTAPDNATLRKAASAKVVATYEDHCVRTGLGAVVTEWLDEHGLTPCLLRFGIPRYASSGEPDELFKLLGIDPETVAELIEQNLKTAK
jgi:transketolase